MPTTIKEDRTYRLVRVEHTCSNGRFTYQAAAMTHLNNDFNWRDEGPFCRHCAERLPQTIEEAEREKP